MTQILKLYAISRLHPHKEKKTACHVMSPAFLSTGIPAESMDAIAEWKSAATKTTTTLFDSLFHMQNYNTSLSRELNKLFCNRFENFLLVNFLYT